MIYFTYRWGYRGGGEGYGWICEEQDHLRHPRPTGMIWRGGCLWYRRPAGPITLFQHVLNENLKMMFLYQIRTLPKFPLLVGIKTGVPAFSGGKTIQFFTYQLKATE